MNETYEIIGDCGRLIFHDFGCNGVPKCYKGDDVFDIHGMEWNGMEWNRMEWNGMEWNGMESNGMESNGMESKIV